MDDMTFVAMCDDVFSGHEAEEYRTRNGYEKVYEKARQQIGDCTQVLSAVVYLRQKLVILHHQEKLNYLKYTQVLDSIREAARRELSPDSVVVRETNWDQLIRIIIDNRKELYFFELETCSQLDSKLHTFAHSYIRLKNLGVKIIEKNYKFYISENSYELINNAIERICRKYGGEDLLSDLMDRLGRTYNVTTGRFMEYRQVSMGTTQVNAAMPFGYLLAIASKYAGSYGNRNPIIFDHFLTLIADIVVIYEIQPYSQYEAMYVSEEKLIDFIKNNILYDNLVGVAQVKASYASSLIRLMQAKFGGAEYKSFGVLVKDVTRVAVALISLADTRKFSTVEVKDIALKTRMPESKVTAAMDKLLSVVSGGVNSSLNFPPSSLDIDHYFKPAIKIGKKYKIFPKSIASLGCINTVCTSIAFPDGQWANEVDSELGYAIEEYLRSAFREKGIDIIFGDRIDGDSDIEVDLLCESDEIIYIFEMKKKGLTRKAQAGDEAKILADLADSVLASHFQAMRIENVLKNNDYLHLASKEGKRSVRLNNRDVRRISVSLSDFGALQDKTVLQRLLTIAVSSNASHPDGVENKKLKKWRDYSEKLKKLAIDNGEFGKGRIPFHNSLFMSVPQIIMILDNSENANEFFKHIRNFISMSTGSRDTYTEFLNHLKLLNRLKVEGFLV